MPDVVYLPPTGGGGAQLFFGTAAVRPTDFSTLTLGKTKLCNIYIYHCVNEISVSINWFYVALAYTGIVFSAYEK